VRERGGGDGGGVGCGGGVETSNNGNVTGQKIWAKKGGGGYLQLQQSYGYL
jgi:hypothetical protein